MIQDMPTLFKRAAIYARVSTIDKNQDPETQLLDLREYAKRRGFAVVGEYVDHASGLSEKKRPQYRAILELAQKRLVDVVLVWRYDRFARSTHALINALTKFQTLGVDFISYQENVDTTTPQGKLIFSIMASLAEFESSLISDRVRAGMRRAEAQGKQISRPRIPKSTQKEIRRMAGDGIPIDRIRKDLGISWGTASTYAKEITGKEKI